MSWLTIYLVHVGLVRFYLVLVGRSWFFESLRKIVKQKCIDSATFSMESGCKFGKNVHFFDEHAPH